MTCQRRVSDLLRASNISHSMCCCFLCTVHSVCDVQYLKCCLCFSPRQDPKCGWKCSAAHVSEVPAVLLAVSAKPGEKPVT